jgi:putative drug exporter of the RND superfamily
MLARLADFSYRRRWLVLGLWIIALVGVTLASGKWSGDWTSGSRLEGTDSQKAYDLFARSFPSKSGDGATVVFAVPDGGVASKRDAIEAFVNDARKIDRVTGAMSPFETDGQISDDGTIAFASIDFDPARATQPAIAPLLARAGPLRAAGVQTEFGGNWFVEGGIPATEGLGLIAAAVILLIAFGSILAAGLPLVTAVIGIGIGLGSVGLWAAVVDTPDFTVQVASMIGIGVGIDYALFIVTRFREAKARGLDPHAATVEAASTAGRAVVFAGLTVMVSLFGMILMRVKFLNGLAVGSATSVAVAVLAAVTLLPALLGMAGRRIKPMHIRTKPGRTFWGKWSHGIQRHPRLAATFGLVVLLAFAAPTAVIRLGTADEGGNPTNQTTRKAYDLLAKGFTPGFSGPFLLVADIATPQAAAALPAAVERVRSTDGFAFVSEAQISDDGKAAIINAIPTTSPQDKATDELLHRVRAKVLAPVAQESGLNVYVGGPTASNSDFAGLMGRRMPVFIGAVLAISFLLLLATFRSVLVPLKAVILNLLSIGAAYGVMVMVFQWGWFGSVFGVGKGAPIEPWAPMMLFAIVFGLSMDYEVFLLARIREHYDATGDNSSAVADGLASTARVISAAAAIMVFVFGLFVFGDLRSIKLIGLGLATAVFIDATIVRLVLVPATMELLGKRNWWIPRWLDRILPHLEIERHTPSSATSAGSSQPLPPPLCPSPSDRDDRRQSTHV